jgi:antitoxin component YwqK of YwqJK toxin-antitoxin module
MNKSKNKPICEVDTTGTKRWYLNGKLHREDGPAVEWADGTKAWYLNGKLHREDGPAIEYTDGTKKWYLNGELHREDGPAVEYADGDKGWYLNGIEYTKQDYYRELVKRGLCTEQEAFVEML